MYAGLPVKNAQLHFFLSCLSTNFSNFFVGDFIPCSIRGICTQVLSNWAQNTYKKGINSNQMILARNGKYDQILH